MNETVAKYLDDLIDALYSSEHGIDGRSHNAVCGLLYAVNLPFGEDEATRRVRDLNARVDATDDQFYFGG